MGKQTKAISVIAIVAIVAVLAIFLVNWRQSGQPNGFSFGRVGSDQATAEPVLDTTSLEFDGSVQLNEPLTVDVRFRDYADLPSDFADYQAEVAKLPPIPGKMTISFKSYQATDKIGLLSARPGYRLHYVTYELSGDADNPSGPRVVPNLPFSGLPDMAPQPVIALGDETQFVQPADYEQMRNYLGLSNPTHIQFDSPGPWLFGAVWERPVDRLPLIALESVDPDGERHLIRLEYR